MHTQEPHDEVKLWAECHMQSYGWDPLNPYIKCQSERCTQPLHIMDTYRCFDCKAVMHQDCLVNHCGISRQLWPVRAEIRTPNHVEAWAIHAFGNNLTSEEREQVIAMLQDMNDVVNKEVLSPDCGA